MLSITWCPTKLDFKANYFQKYINLHFQYCIEIIHEKSFYGNQIFFKNKTRLGTNQGVFRKEETNGYLNINKINGVTNVENV